MSNTKPRTVTHIDVAYDEETAAEISMLRAERWGHLTTITHMTRLGSATAKSKCRKLWNQVARIDARLFKLTKNPVYK